MKTLSTLLLFLLLVTSCKQNFNEPEPVLEAKQIMDVSYGNATEQTFDVYLPKGRGSSTKIIVFFHGGGWKDEDKSMYAPLLTYFVDNGFAVINANYRLAKDNADKFPVQMQDIEQVIDQVLSDHNEYSVSDKIALAGNSAGAHLVLLYAYAYDTNGRVKAVAAQSAPTDLVQAANSGNTQAINTVTYFLGKTYDEDAELWKNASPYWKVTANAPPTILFVGEKDDVVVPQQSVSLQQRLNTLQVKNQLIRYPNEGHAWLGANLNDTRKKIVDWLNANVD
ncbi:alpha/beta hydrolase [Solitalea sp. MAHUQ-68]|uniref:Alpha/beta hydrolase n=1 Tax=Solitalea agri TaxID=2953739 RepID=A0A9X2JDY2_9SPHI|nr:alpha/beta hydrolase [Solitalea agri]MCO4293365.1 alpha/beta hydrolase [Solitalea agri]